jgi:hypothetical protein
LNSAATGNVNTWSALGTTSAPSIPTNPLMQPTLRLPVNSVTKKESIVKRSLFQRMLRFAAAACLAACGAQAPAQQMIIQDIFTAGTEAGTPLGAESADNIPGVALAPTPTDLTSGTWQHISGAFGDAKEFSGTVNGILGDGDTTTADLAAFYDASSGIALGAYNTGSLHISARTSFLTKAYTPLPPIGAFILVGFSSALNSGSNNGPSALSTFTGLAVTGSAGSLQEYVNGSPVGDPIAFKGNYSPYTDTMLSYTIDTVTGAISDASFGNSKANYSFPAPESFSHSFTTNVDLGGSVGIGPGGGTTVQFTGTDDASSYLKADGNPGTLANYVVFSGVTGSSVTINAQVGGRDGLVGFQIVERGPATHRSIGLNFSGTPIPSGTSAGVVAQTYWNDLRTAAPGSLSTVVDSTGATVSGVSATWTSYNNGANALIKDDTSRFPNAGDNDLFSQNWFVYSSAPGSDCGQVFTVAGIPYASYDVYVYTEGNSGNAALVNLNGVFTGRTGAAAVSSFSLRSGVAAK